MLSTKYKYVALALGVMFIALAINASAQLSPGDSQEIQVPTNNSSMSNSQLNNSSINATSMENSTAVSPAAVLPSASATESSGKEILDLSGYARDRTNKNLAGYKNIMYPISGSRGTTTSTAGGGGGCGCG